MSTSNSAPSSTASLGLTEFFNLQDEALRRNLLNEYGVEQYAALTPAPLEQAEALEQLRALWHGHRIAVVVSETDIPPGVDTPADLDAVRRMMQ